MVGIGARTGWFVVLACLPLQGCLTSLLWSTLDERAPAARSSSIDLVCEQVALVPTSGDAAPRLAARLADARALAPWGGADRCWLLADGEQRSGLAALALHGELGLEPERASILLQPDPIEPATRPLVAVVTVAGRCAPEAFVVTRSRVDLPTAVRQELADRAGGPLGARAWEIRELPWLEWADGGARQAPYRIAAVLDERGRLVKNLGPLEALRNSGRDAWQRLSRHKVFLTPANGSVVLETTMSSLRMAELARIERARGELQWAIEADWVAHFQQASPVEPVPAEGLTIPWKASFIRRELDATVSGWERATVIVLTPITFAIDVATIGAVGALVVWLSVTPGEKPK